jgi:hypothetical protein
VRAIFCIAVVCALACGGCIPFTVYDSPRVSGSVLDSATNAPVANATILVVSTEQGRGNSTGHTTTAVSDASGHFAAAQVTHRIWLPPLPFDMISPDARLEVSAGGFESQEVDFLDLLQTASSNGDITVRLKKQ